jgi:hypothetical protein
MKSLGRAFAVHECLETVAPRSDGLQPLFQRLVRRVSNRGGSKAAAVKPLTQLALDALVGVLRALSINRGPFVGVRRPTRVWSVAGRTACRAQHVVFA